MKERSMIQAEYRRDMQHNYLVIHDESQMDAGYQEKMLYYNKMIGFVPFHVQYMNGERLISYEVHGYQPLVEVCNRFPLKGLQLKKIVENLFEILFEAGEYLLKEDDLLLSIDYMFVHLPSYQLSLCYYAGYQIPIKKQLAEFFERLMTCVEYEDKEAVYLIYTLYMKSKELNVTMEDLLQLLKKNSHEDGLEEKNFLEKEEIELNKRELNPWMSKDDCNKPSYETYKRNEEINKSKYDSNKQSDDSNKQSDDSIKRSDDSIKRNDDSRKRNNDSMRHNDNSRKREDAEKKGVDNSFMLPQAVKAAYEPPNKPVVHASIKKPFSDTKGAISSRPLISNTRQEEQEVLSYPFKYYLYAGLILVVALLVCAAVSSAGVLKDSVTKQIEPIKIIGLLLVVCLPAGYGIYQLFQPKNREVKEVTIGLYEPIIHQEIAAAVEIPVYEDSLNQQHSRLDTKYRSISKESEYQEMKEPQRDKNMPEMPNIEKLQSEDRERRTVLLQKGVDVAFPQLVSESPELAETIPIQECPFFIGTAKNRLNYSLTSPVISRYHAKIEEMEGTYFLSDLSSTNGTFLNGKRLTPEEPNVLIPGDKISFANICFIFTCPNS